MAYIISGFFMFFRIGHVGVQIRQILANLVDWIPTCNGSKSYRGHYCAREYDDSLRRYKPILEHTCSNSDGAWDLPRPAPAETELALVEELFSFCQVRQPAHSARKALDEFGSIPKFFHAPERRLKSIGIDSATLQYQIKLIKNSLEHYLNPRRLDRIKLKNFKGLTNYLVFHHGYLAFEQARVLFFDGQNNLIDDQMISDGSVDQCAMFTRSIVHKALDLGANGLVLVHNHPTGDPSPSRQDIAITKEICDACRTLNLAVFDHLIIAGDQHYSFKSNGLM